MAGAGTTERNSIREHKFLSTSSAKPTFLLNSTGLFLISRGKILSLRLETGGLHTLASHVCRNPLGNSRCERRNRRRRGATPNLNLLSDL